MFLSSALWIFGGGHPQHDLPAPFPCLLCCSGHPTLHPGNVPPSPHHPKGLFPFSTPGKQRSQGRAGQGKAGVSPLPRADSGHQREGCCGITQGSPGSRSPGARCALSPLGAAASPGPPGPQRPRRGALQPGRSPPPPAPLRAEPAAIFSKSSPRRHGRRSQRAAPRQLPPPPPPRPPRTAQARPVGAMAT